MAQTYPVVNAGNKYAYGMGGAYASATTLTVNLGQDRDSANINDIVLAANATINGAVNGANGLDTGTLANSTLYNVFAINDSTKYQATAAVLSTQTIASGPIKPFGYDGFRWLFTAKTDGSANFLPFRITGNGLRKTYWYDTPISVLAAGNDATSFTDVDLSGSMPAMATDVILNVAFTPATAENELKLRAKGSSATNGSVQVTGVVAAKVQKLQVIVPCSSAGLIQYLVSNGSDAATITLAGYILDL
jgi:hypothetical protein